MGLSVCSRCAADDIDCGYAACDAIRLEALRVKLDDMELHDATGDPVDVGYMDAISEIREWLKHD